MILLAAFLWEILRLSRLHTECKKLNRVKENFGRFALITNNGGSMPGDIDYSRCSGDLNRVLLVDIATLLVPKLYFEDIYC